MTIDVSAIPAIRVVVVDPTREAIDAARGIGQALSDCGFLGRSASVNELRVGVEACARAIYRVEAVWWRYRRRYRIDAPFEQAAPQRLRSRLRMARQFWHERREFERLLLEADACWV